MDRAELATFLRGRRERIAPADVGLPAGRRRRTPGLRREEVAQLAYISTEYYTRLEQARGPHPSREVVTGLARALRLSDAERDHLSVLAGLPPGPPPGPSRTVRPSVQLMLDRLPGSAAFVTSATSEVIAWNGLAAALMEDFSAVSRQDRTLVRRAFLGLGNRSDRMYGVSDVDEYARSAAARLRRTAARYPDDPEVTALVDELLAGSPEFADLWAAADVDVARTLRKTFRHPLVGPVTVNCDALDITDQDQQVVVYTADPGSPSEEALRLLAVVGTQRMTAAT
ncbi:helix-turn-helix transcriptional regulator [Promicromonospora thailandica]|uniref:Helix-turn-helix domain-containing protein n=1 Tax=Promicromonospora thailandica TaxID=765201 RepID=A0A9X2JTQ7_9MICO|nr:helix-turn-helix transcriptional regulator [Promicromonospora thailandica]MCP2263221.1 Helix-turn-helix domain-containing protein [Promicromonospora thailandica]BFF18609.1 helix-turn-helix transcriptional regulator [Promicromonospora thailandica]